MTKDPAIRETLRKLLDQAGESAAAECLRQPGTGVISLPQSMANTRDGREEAIAMLQEAFEDERIGAVVIRRDL
jgi:hypothetical protein